MILKALGRLFGYDSDYKRDARILTSERIDELLVEICHKRFGHSFDPATDSDISETDMRWLALEPIRLQTLVLKNVNLTHIQYHANSDEFPDCDDFANNRSNC